MSAPIRLTLLGGGTVIGFLAARRAVREAMAWPLDGRVAIVTGGTRGLGLLIARELLDAGCRVAICGRDAKTLDQAVSELGDRPHLLAAVCDVGDRDHVRRFVERVRADLGSVDLLVANASTISVGRASTMDAEHFETAMRDIFWGTLNAVLELLPEMQTRQAGRICVIGSIGGRISAPHLLPYAAAKFAQIGLSEGLRAELASDGIVVTTVVPGFMRTGSFLASDFHAPSTDEYAWFTTGATLPVLTLSPKWAARRIVRAIRHGEGDVTLGWFARLGGALKSNVPGLAADVMGLVERWVLPDGRLDGTTSHERGTSVHADAPAPVKALATPSVRQGVNELNQPPPAE